MSDGRNGQNAHGEDARRDHFKTTAMVLQVAAWFGHGASKRTPLLVVSEAAGPTKGRNVTNAQVALHDWSSPLRLLRDPAFVKLMSMYALAKAGQRWTLPTLGGEAAAKSLMMRLKTCLSNIGRIQDMQNHSDFGVVVPDADLVAVMPPMDRNRYRHKYANGEKELLGSRFDAKEYPNGVLTEKISGYIDSEVRLRGKGANLSRRARLDVQYRTDQATHMPVKLGQVLWVAFQTQMEQGAEALRTATICMVESTKPLVHPYFAVEGENSVPAALVDQISLLASFGVAWSGAGLRPVAQVSIANVGVHVTFTIPFEFWTSEDDDDGHWEERMIEDVMLSTLLAEVDLEAILRNWANVCAKGGEGEKAKAMMIVQPAANKIETSAGIVITDPYIVMGTLLACKLVSFGANGGQNALAQCRTYCHSSKAEVAARAAGKPGLSDLSKLSKEQMVKWGCAAGLPIGRLLTLFTRLVAQAEASLIKAGSPLGYTIDPNHIVMYDFRRLAMNTHLFLWYKGVIWDELSTLPEVLAHIATISGTSPAMLEQYYIYPQQLGHRMQEQALLRLGTDLQSPNHKEANDAVAKLAQISKQTAVDLANKQAAAAKESASQARKESRLGEVNATRAKAREFRRAVSDDTKEFLGDPARSKAFDAKRTLYIRQSTRKLDRAELAALEQHSASLCEALTAYDPKFVDAGVDDKLMRKMGPAGRDWLLQMMNEGLAQKLYVEGDADKSGQINVYANSNTVEGGLVLVEGSFAIAFVLTYHSDGATHPAKTDDEIGGEDFEWACIIAPAQTSSKCRFPHFEIRRWTKTELQMRWKPAADCPESDDDDDDDSSHSTTSGEDDGEDASSEEGGPPHHLTPQKTETKKDASTKRKDIDRESTSEQEEAVADDRAVAAREIQRPAHKRTKPHTGREIQRPAHKRTKPHTGGAAALLARMAQRRGSSTQAKGVN
jgi:hypothetical protein